MCSFVRGVSTFALLGLRPPSSEYLGWPAPRSERMLRVPMTSLPPPVQSVLELFQGPLASVRFADIDAAGLAQLAAEVEAASEEVREHESKLGELRQTLAQRQEALLALAQRALAYARVYAENDEALLDAVNRISLPRAAKPRKAPASAKGTGARDAGGEAAVAAETETAALDPAGSDADVASGADTAEPVRSDAEAEAAASPPPATPPRGSRKGRAAASQRAAN